MTKQTASNNELLKRVKATYNKATYKEVSKMLNEKGESAARELLNTFTLRKRY